MNWRAISETFQRRIGPLIHGAIPPDERQPPEIPRAFVNRCAFGEIFLEMLNNFA